MTDTQKLQPPALPQSPAVYSQSYHDNTNNVFRLFFRRLVSVVNTLATGERVIWSDLPTTDPLITGQLWNDAGTVKISAGPP